MNPEDSKELFLKLLEHDRWRTETLCAHELELERLRLNKPGQKRKTAPDQIQDLENSEDVEFNLASSYGACDSNHIGLLAKTKTFKGADEKATEIYSEWYNYIQERNVLPLKDLKEGRIRNLLLVFLWSSSCAQRAARWPEAKDITYIDSLKEEFKARLCKFSKHSIVAAYESLKTFWPEVGGGTNFDSSLIADYLDEAYDFVTSKEAAKKATDLKQSPLFLAFNEAYPEVSLELLEKNYINSRKKFIEAGVKSLSKVFTTVCPPELKEEVDEGSWPRKWHLYIEPYRQKWQSEVKVLYNLITSQQAKWSAQASQTEETE